MKFDDWRLSWAAACLAVAFVFYFGLAVPALVGVLVYTLIANAADRFVSKGVFRHGMAEKVAVATVSVAILLAFVGVGFALWRYIASGAPAKFISHLAQAIDAGAEFLPDYLSTHIPGWMTTEASLRQHVVKLLGEHAGDLAAAGQGGLAAILRAFVGALIGAMAGWRLLTHPSVLPECFLSQLRSRFNELAETVFTLIVVQAKISGINAFLTAVFLGIALPAFGMHLEHPLLLATASFFFGLLPVAGNLISNTVVFLACLTVSPVAAISGLLFLAAIHKGEYFLQAKFASSSLEIPVWELLAALFVMEKVAGIPGLVFAPIGLAWIRNGLILPLATEKSNLGEVAEK